MVGRHIRKASLWFALLVILATSLLSLAPLPSATPKAQAQTQTEIIRWFDVGNSSLPGQPYPIIVTHNAGSRPAIGIPSDETESVKRPSLVFRLSHVEGVGSNTTNNTEWLIFKAYASGSQEVKNLYLVGDDGDTPTMQFYYSENEAEVNIGNFANAVKLNSKISVRIEATGGSQEPKDDTVNYLFRHLMNDAADDSKNCGAGTVLVSGPKIDGREVIVAWRNDLPGYARYLNGNCLNIDTNKDKSWSAFWGVTTHSSPADSANDACGLGGIVKGGVGGIIVKVIACTVQTVFDGVVTKIIDYGKALGGEQDKLEDRLKNPDDALVKAWQYSRGLINIIVILALLLIAFANILHININTYAAKKALPGLVIGVIGANASLLLIRFVLDVSQAVMQLGYDVLRTPQLPNPGLPDLINKFITTLGVVATSNTVVLATLSLFALLIIIIFTVYFICLIFVLIFFLIKRLILLYGLTVIAPLAFIAYGVPTMQQWFGKWWDMFIRQVFVVPIIVVAMALFVKYAETLGFNISFGENPDPTSILNAALLLGVATMILKLPGLITKGALDISAAAKKAFGIAKGAPTSMYGGLQGASAGMKKRYDAKAALATTAAERKHFESKAARWKQTAGTFAAARGRSYIATNPSKTVGDWWKKRTELGDKESKKQATMANLGTPKIKIGGKTVGVNFNLNQALQGGPGAFDSAKDWAGELANKASSIDEANDILTKGGQAKNIAAAFLKHEDTLSEEKKKSFRGRVIALLQGNLDDVEKLMNEAAVPLVDRGSAWDRGLVAAHYKAKQRVLRDEADPNQRKNVLTTVWDNANNKTPPPTPFGGGSATPSADPTSSKNPLNIGDTLSGASSPSGSNANQTASNPNLTINAGNVDVNTSAEVGVDPNVAARFGRLKDLAGAIKNPTQKQKEDGEMETPGEAEARHIGELEGLSGEWGEFATKSLDNLTTEEQAQLDDLRTRTGQAFDDTIGNSALRAGAEQLLSSSDAGTLQQLTGGLAEVVQHRDMLEKPASLERLIANRSAVGKEASALNEAGGQFVASQDMEKLIGAINGQPEAFASQLQELVEPHYKEMTQALNKQGSTEELKQMTATIVNGWRNAISGRDRRSMASILRTSMTTMGDTVAKQVSYGQLTPNVNVNVEAGKPNIIVEPPNAQNVTNITNENISNQTTNEINQSPSPVNPGQSATTESLASELRSRVEPPPTEPPVPPSTS